MAEVLVAGNGGRESELARFLSNSDSVSNVYITGGNAGTAKMENVSNVPVAPNSVDEIVSFAREKQPDLVVVGPERLLEAGLVNQLGNIGIDAFGPNLAAAELEYNKAFAASFMEMVGIPHPKTDLYKDYEEALGAIEGRNPEEYVVKDNVLADGKGVFLPRDTSESQKALSQIFHSKVFGTRREALIQDRLHGQEVSAMGICDGENFLLLPIAQDYKRLGDKDKGPNTGGMGAYAPAIEKIINRDQIDKIMEIGRNTIDSMNDRLERPFRGVLYIGTILAEEYDGAPYVLEYNVRFGDPEAQVVLPLLELAGVDAYALLKAAAADNIGDAHMLPRNLGSTAMSVCLASEGYPDEPILGREIRGLDRDLPEDVIVHHAGTYLSKNGKYLTAGGRVLHITGLGENGSQAAANSYSQIGTINFDGMQYRNDIGHQARLK